MQLAALGAKAALAVMLLVAGGAKLADLPGFAATARLFLPRRVRPAQLGVARGVAVVELALGAASLSWPAAAWLNQAVLAAGCGFTAVAAVGYTFHRGRSCRCFGALSRRRFDLAGILRSLVIVATAVLATARVTPPAVALGAAARVLLLVASVLLAAASYAAARALAASRDAQPRLAPR